MPSTSTLLWSCRFKLCVYCVFTFTLYEWNGSQWIKKCCVKLYLVINGFFIREVLLLHNLNLRTDTGMFVSVCCQWHYPFTSLTHFSQLINSALHLLVLPLMEKIKPRWVYHPNKCVCEVWTCVCACTDALAVELCSLCKICNSLNKRVHICSLFFPSLSVHKYAKQPRWLWPILMGG